MDSNDNSVPAHQCPCSGTRTLAFLILRFWIACTALASGLAKFSRAEKVFEENPETGEMSSTLVRNYAWEFYNGVPAREFERLLGDALFPEWVLQAFYYALGPALILCGLALLLGIATRMSLVVLGLIFVALSFGLSLIDTSGSAGTLGIYVIAIAGALLLADNNRFCLSRKF